MTIVEALLAMTILSIIVLALTYATAAGHQHLRAGETGLRAVSVAEDLIEEILSRPYHGSGGTVRADYHLDDYDGFEEELGEDELTDFTGAAYGEAYQAFGRSATVSEQQHTLAELGGTQVQGKKVTVTVEDGRGQVWTLRRFVPEPAEP